MTSSSLTPVGASFAQALLAAQQACAQQNYPRGALYVVATPIGNLADVTLRAIAGFHAADIVLAEDTRVTGKLLNHIGIKQKLIRRNVAEMMARVLPAAEIRRLDAASEFPHAAFDALAQAAVGR